MNQDGDKRRNCASKKSRKNSKKQLEKQVEEWRARALLAETRLSSLASIPTDSIGWLNFRKEKAREALRELLDALDAKEM